MCYRWFGNDASGLSGPHRKVSSLVPMVLSGVPYAFYSMQGRERDWKAGEVGHTEITFAHCRL